jgi:hypothetical protein
VVWAGKFTKRQDSARLRGLRRLFSTTTDTFVFVVSFEPRGLCDDRKTPCLKGIRRRRLKTNLCGASAHYEMEHQRNDREQEQEMYQSSGNMKHGEAANPRH